LDCEVCGSPIFGKGVKVLIDGARLLVCGRCASRATTVKAPSKRESLTPPAPKVPRARPQPQTRRGPSAPKFPVGGELADNYGQVVRKAREAMHLSQEDLCRRIAEKVSVLQKIESERLVPDDSLVRKLEQALKIQLMQLPSKEPPAEEEFSRPMDLTLGDVAIMQKRRGEGEDTRERRS